MCGICGYTGCVDQHVLREMTATLAHRGPDDSGTQLFDTVGLGHVRLSIIDLSPAGHQPMSNEDGAVWISYNGEVYDHDALREALEGRGHVFRSTSDTEVIVHLYEQYGMDFLERLRGFFGLAIWDVKERKLILARDRLGIKPLFWTDLPGGNIAFSSEIKGLLRHPGVSRTLDHQALVDYLAYLYVPAPRTMFSGINKLAPGHVLVWQDGKTTVREYWDVPMDAPPQSTRRSTQSLLEELDGLLDDAIRLRMRSDVPFGAFLSGGLDSSTIVAFMSRHATRPVRTFAVVFDKSGRQYDERSYADMVAKRFRTEHHEISVSADVVDLLPKIVSHFDEPFGNPTALLAYMLCRETRKHVTVVLGGDGGDEVFGGYPRYRGALLAHYAAVALPSLLRRQVLPRMARLISEDTSGKHAPRRLREFLRGLSLDPEDMYFSWVGYWNHAEQDALFARHEGARHDGKQFMDALFRRVRAVPFNNRLPYVDLKSFLPYNVLAYGDRMSMAHALEMRVPLIDHKLVEFMARLPFRLKVRLTTDKFLLRKLMARELPAAVLKRPKLGFNPPMGVWINEDLAPLIADYLSPERLKRRGLFDAEAVETMLGEHAAGKRDWTWRIWALLVLECWMRSYLD